MLRELVAGAVMVAVLAGVVFMGTYRRADSVCTSDPPGSTWSAHDSRQLDLRVNGWECRLAGDGDTTVVVQLGWWPTTEKMR